MQLIITLITAAKLQPWCSSVASAYQTAIAHGCGFSGWKIRSQNKKLTGVCSNKMRLWKREEIFSQTGNFNIGLQYRSVCSRNVLFERYFKSFSNCWKILNVLQKCVLKKSIFVTIMMVSFTKFYSKMINMILLHQKLTFKIKLTWQLRKCVLVHYDNELFSITATKGKKVAVPTEVRTY